MHCLSSCTFLTQTLRQAFESFVLRCPKEITPHLDAIVSVALRFVKHDPNYADEDEDDQMEEDEDDEEEEEYSDDDGDYSGCVLWLCSKLPRTFRFLACVLVFQSLAYRNLTSSPRDDDSSWKVRSGAVKCLGAVIRTRPEMLNALYDKVLPQLMSRFREREEIVKMEVFSAFKDLMRQSQGRSDVVDAMEEDGVDVDAGAGHPVSKLLDVAKVMKAVQKQLKDKSFKTKERCLELLRELILVLEGGLHAYLPSLIKDLQKCVEKSAKTSLKVEALTLLCLIIEKHPGADLRQHVKILGPSVLASVADSNYKISAVALRVCGRLCMATFEGGRLLQHAGADNLVADMYIATFGRLSSQDQDLEVKEAAIITMGKMVACLGDMVGPQRLSACLPVMLDRLKNETTRVMTLKVLCDIAKSELKTDISNVCSDAVLECSTFLRKNDRALKQAALTTLTALIASYSASIRPQLYEAVTKELAALVSSDELHLTHLSLQLCSCMVVHAPGEAIPQVHSHVLPKCIVLLHSPLLQGAARTSLKELYAKLVLESGQGCGFKELLESLLGIVYGGGAQLSRQSLSSIAQCVSSLCIADQKESRATVERFIKDLSDAQAATSEQVRQLLLHCIGEIGRELDLSGFLLENVVMASFASASEDTKAAASLALGSLALGATEKYLPFILTQVTAQAEYRYVRICALLSFISRHNALDIVALHCCSPHFSDRVLCAVTHSFQVHAAAIVTAAYYAEGE
jgi:cullin-associated NEDD8-dissociated protein 1